MLSYLRKFLNRNDEGASAVEYGLLVAGIAVLITVAIFTLGGSIRDMFGTTNTCISTGTC